MSKKHIKAVKQKVKHLISPELVIQKRYNEIVSQFNENMPLSYQDKYLYGYSLLKAQELVDALIMLWPLASKKYNVLMDDCAAIAYQVTRDEPLSAFQLRSEDALHTLFLAIRALVPNSPWNDALRQQLFDLLWHNHHHEKFERILKSMKDRTSAPWVENQGKLAFFQAKSKLSSGNIPAFIGLVLTGGACLMMQHVMYQTEIDSAFRALGHEIKQLLSSSNGAQKLAWDRMLIEHFIDYEVDVLSEMMQCWVHGGSVGVATIPTPSYFMSYAGSDEQLNQTFLPWVSKQKAVYTSFYQADMQQIVLWVLGGDKLSLMKTLLKSVEQTALSPYLRLAIMLRASCHKNDTSLLNLVNIHDFEYGNETLSVFKNLVIYTATAIINSKASIATPDFWRILDDFSAILSRERLSIALLKNQSFSSTGLSSSLLSQLDPFKTLDVSITDSKPLILKKMMKLTQQSPENMAMFRQAQSEVFNPAQRFVHHYLRVVNHEQGVMSEVESVPVSSPLRVQDIPLRREIFDACA